MWLDADDVLPAPDAEKLLAFKAELDSCPCDVIMMPYDTAFDEEMPAQRTAQFAAGDGIGKPVQQAFESLPAFVQ